MNAPELVPDGANPLCVFGGTFDPVHHGHLRVAWEATEALQGDTLLVPCRQPPHRPAPLATAEQRLAMLQLALVGQTRLRCDARELLRPGPSYMFDTLAELRDDVGNRRPLVLLLGSDAFAGLSRWHRWRELFDLAHIGVLTRPGHTPDVPDELRAALAARSVAGVQQLCDQAAGRVARIAVTPLEISASRIRAILEAGQEARYLLPDSVLQYIARTGLYRATVTV